MKMTIEHLTSSVPRYIQIADLLISQIESGELAPGDRLPSERELSERFAVQRVTLRQALGILESQGLIDRRQGSGTYIARPKIEREAGRLFPFTKVLRRKGYLTGSKVIMFEKTIVNTAAALELQLPLGSMVYHGHRLRLLNQEPVMIEKFYLPANILPGFEIHDLTNRSMYEIMETEYGVIVNRARQSLEAVSATEYEANLLEVDKGAPLMLERRVTTDQNGQLVEYSKDLYRGDRFRFVTEITPPES
jgi:GntR family transcriptional regulator